MHLLQIIVASVPDELRGFATGGYSHVGKAETSLRALPSELGRKSIVSKQTFNIYHVSLALVTHHIRNASLDWPFNSIAAVLLTLVTVDCHKWCMDWQLV